MEKITLSFGKASVMRPSVNGKVKYARIPIIRKSLIINPAREYAEQVVASRDGIPEETPMDILEQINEEIANDFANGIRYALSNFMKRDVEE